MSQGVDRRVARTRRALHEALMSLILRKDYDAITIQDILDEADIGRSTFYAHYAGKDDLLRRGFEQLRAELRQAQSSRVVGRSGFGFSLAMFEHAVGYKHIYRALVGGRGGVTALAEIRRALSDVVKAELSSIPEDRDLPRELRARFVVDAFLTVLTWWLERKPALAPGDVDRMFHQLLGGTSLLRYTCARNGGAA